MARNVPDLALMLDAMAVHNPSHRSARDTETSYLRAAFDAKKPLRIAFSADLGITPVDPEIAEIATRPPINWQKMVPKL